MPFIIQSYYIFGDQILSVMSADVRFVIFSRNHISDADLTFDENVFSASNAINSYILCYSADRITNH